jgi:hypothetical protein
MQSRHVEAEVDYHQPKITTCLVRRLTISAPKDRVEAICYICLLIPRIVLWQEGIQVQLSFDLGDIGKSSRDSLGMSG